MKRNTKAITFLFILLLGISLTFAYFVGRALFGGEGAITHASTATINNAQVTVEGNLEIENADNMLPGHKMVSYLKVTATGDNVLIPFNLVWKGTNGLGTTLKIMVYRASQSNDVLNVKANCSKKQGHISAGTIVYEECDITNIKSLGNPVGTGEIPTSETEESVTLAADQFITATSGGSSDYYYVVLEYPNENSSQNSDMGHTFNGEVTAEASETEPDIDIVAVYVEDEDGEYKKAEDGKVPEGAKYILNKEKSICNNEAIPTWDNYTKQLTINNFNKEGTSCYLYYKISMGGITLDSLNLHTNGDIGAITGPSCGSCAMTENGLYQTEDNDGESYVFRGTVKNNWVKFADKLWRIIRINGDGSIRLIYAGTNSSHVGDKGNGTNALTDKPYNKQNSDNTYVGFTNAGTTTSSYEQARSGSTESDILKDLNSWYESNLQVFENKLEKDAGFCNDRQLSKYNHDTSYQNDGIGNHPTWYAPFDRVTASTTSTSYASIGSEQKPTLKCGSSDEDFQKDYYTVSDASRGNQKLKYPIGLITMDEVIFAGGFAGQTNDGYWLYTGEHYWTMSPHDMSANGLAYVSFVRTDGNISNDYVSNTNGVRPVINLKADTTFTTNKPENKGTIDNPYIVE